MYKKTSALVLLIISLLMLNTACLIASPFFQPTATSIKSTEQKPEHPTSTPKQTPTPLPQNPISPEDLSQEPAFISGFIEYSSPFFLNSIGEPFVMLEDQAGFVKRDNDFEFRLESQIIGPVEITDDNKLAYYLSLPSIPQGTFVDVNHDNQKDQGVQVFAVAYWSNTWGDPFLEIRDGTGWSTAYSSTITDPDKEYEITGGILIVWSPDHDQEFSNGFGSDGLLFTDDDPIANISAGYSLVNLNEEPFRYYKQPNITIDLIEGDVAIKDFSKLDYGDAFEAMFLSVSEEYPFTKEKQINWSSLQETYFEEAKNAKNDEEFYEVLQEFCQNIPDGHVNLSFNADIFFEQYGGGFGLLLTELSDGKVIAKEILPGLSAEKAGLKIGSEILEWDGKPVSDAIAEVIPGFGPYSTQHTKRIAQTDFLTLTDPLAEIKVKYINPNESRPKESTLRARIEYETLFRLISGFNEDSLALPVEGNVLSESGLGYIRINTFSDDYQLMASIWDHYLNTLAEDDIPGVIIDLRNNTGGSLGLALDFAGYFFDEEFALYKSAYFNSTTNSFEYNKHPAIVKPAPMYYEGEVAVLIGPDCISACEGFAYALSTSNRSTLIGHYPTAGAFGEVGRGQYKLPGDISLQFPTGRPETLNGELLIEGFGVQPDIIVPITKESTLAETDSVLETAIQTLLKAID